MIWDCSHYLILITKWRFLKRSHPGCAPWRYPHSLVPFLQVCHTMPPITIPIVDIIAIINIIQIVKLLAWSMVSIIISLSSSSYHCHRHIIVIVKNIFSLGLEHSVERLLGGWTFTSAEVLQSIFDTISIWKHHVVGHILQATMDRIPPRTCLVLQRLKTEMIRIWKKAIKW